MSIDSISGNTTAANGVAAQQKGPGGKIGQDFQALAKALSSGDLTAAKTAFATMQTDMKNRPDKKNDGDGDDKGAGTTSATGSSSSSSTNPMQALASALQSGDLSGAQSALAQMQSGKGHHHHHHGGGSGSGSTGSTDATSSTTAASVDSFLASLTSTGSSTSSTGSSTAADPFGISGQNVDVQA